MPSTKASPKLLVPEAYYKRPTDRWLAEIVDVAEFAQ
jgi:hypothetical protein